MNLVRIIKIFDRNLKNTFFFSFMSFFTVIALAQAKTSEGVTDQSVEATKAEGTSQKYKTVEWIDLLPKDDLEALLNPPEYITNIEENSTEDVISNQLRGDTSNARADRYQQALNSSRIVSKMDGSAIRIPGFIVPLEFDDMQTITQFFLVPWFGACIHLPPPPPNQIILTNYPKGLKLESLYEPFWISGVLKTSLVENELASAAYVLEMNAYEPYTED